MSTTEQTLEVIGIVGCGLMGRGIAQIAAQGGMPVILHDARPGAAEEARDAIAATLQKLADKGKISAQDALDAGARLSAAASLDELASCTAVVEAIVEQLDAKQALFRQLEAVVSAGCILATNTSSLSVTSIAAVCQAPGRVAGFHFFSPVPLMKIVEVIAGPLTDAGVPERLSAIARRMGHAPVRASDTPGFIVNHAGRGYLTESLRILGENIAAHPELDRILREAAGFRMGPFELLDLTGLDVSQPVMESIYGQYYQEPRFRPSPIARQRLAAGLLGRKSGRGFYVYQDGQRQDAAPAPVPQRSDAPVWLGAADAHAWPAVDRLLDALGAARDRGERPAESSLCLVLPLGQDATTLAVAAGLDPARTVALDPLFISGRRTLMTTPLTDAAFRDAAHALFAADGTPVSVIRDSAGLVCQRVLATIVNIGADIAQQGIASPEDIDKAVTLGLGYPKGPLALGDALGAATVLRILDALFDFYRDPRYRPSPWLKRRALLGVSLLTPEN
ncbi:3-hydroxyacyl-CoA dehydrogenase [Massilia sp. WF1]|uniref:3-hydroxyacyl-CoA dehydrogenase n=1 Tax=unclassified Massilia TaxID=2609279 RepID=UPI000649E008|nr:MULTISPECIES: 3-hydroxyacyl-CoA dehydrogenase [unclassified Massilia]ALK97087.1 3-hydroxyacyl-CoA dehydrogenase [Massilia sp. WG5]KLU36151.1 3-hydroxyacyl-CoA dehydrogenase [Massilia sp. WF1]